VYVEHAEAVAVEAAGVEEEAFSSAGAARSEGLAAAEKAAAARATAAAQAAEARASALAAELASMQRQLESAHAAAAAAAEREAEAARLAAAAATAAAAAAAAAAAPPPSARDAEDAGLCVICLESERTHALIPCGHKCLCGKCAERYEAHMRLDASWRGRDNGPDGDAAAGKERQHVEAGPVGKGKRGGQGSKASSSSSQPPDWAKPPAHTCPLCREAVTSVLLVWE